MTSATDVNPEHTVECRLSKTIQLLDICATCNEQLADGASCWEASCAGALDARARNEPTLWVPFRLLESTTPLWALGEAAG